VDIYNAGGILVAKTLSEADGYYSYLGLPPGSFTIQPDPAQLKKLNLKFPAGAFICTIQSSYTGNTYQDIDFILQPNPVNVNK
jgi:hypothetical protein